jgi:hypothetical protein
MTFKPSWYEISHKVPGGTLTPHVIIRFIGVTQLFHTSALA